jgi:LCP family protein required for cell wall assembly
VRGSRVVAAVASFLVLLGSGYGWAQYRSFASGVRQVDALGSSGPDRDGAAQNILLIGDDSRPANASPEVLAQLSTQEDGGSVNTDTLMILHIPAGGGQASVVSIPRDSWVSIPGAGKGKINSAFAIGASHGGGDPGGMRSLIQTVQDLTGVTIDHFVKVSLLGFYEIAQALGPLQVCLNHAVKEPLSGVDLPAGVSTLNAKQALSFVRQRHGLPRGDLDREVRQQYFLSRELAKVTSTGVLLNPGKLNKLLTAVSDALETDPRLDLLDFATQFRDVSAGSVHFATIPNTGTPTIRDDNGNAVSIVAVDTVALPAFFAQLGGVPAAYGRAEAADPSSVSVRVVNGTGTSGLATSTGSALTRLGFRVAGTANASSTTSLTTVTYPAGQEAAAKAVAQKVPGALVAQVAGVQQVTLTLGTDGLKVSSTSSSPAAAPSRSPASSAPAASSAAAPSTPAATPGTAYSATSCIN